MEHPILASKKRSEFEMVYDLLWQLRREPLARTRACMLANLTWARTNVLFTAFEKAGLVEKIPRPRTSYHKAGPGSHSMILTEKGCLFLNHVDAARKLLEPIIIMVVAE